VARTTSAVLARMSCNDSRCSRNDVSAWDPSVRTGTTNSGFPDMLDPQVFSEREMDIIFPLDVAPLPHVFACPHCIRGQPTQHRRGLRIEDRGSNVLALFQCLRSSILHRPC